MMNSLFSATLSNFRNSLIFLSLFFSSFVLNAQFDAGIMVGMSNYMGELSNQELNGNHYHFAMGVLGRYKYRERLSVSGHLYYGSISGDDADNKSKYWTPRNLNFRSNILELGVQNEIDLMVLDFDKDKYFAPYLFVGITGYYFNPKTVINDKLVELQPLGTEGQDLYIGMEKYKKYGIAFPFGAGLKYLVNEKLTFGFELGMRKTFNDYIDDVSSFYPDIEALSVYNPLAGQLSFRTPELISTSKGRNPVGQKRGNPDNKDWLFFGGVVITVEISKKKNVVKGF